jgi:hypothetical protein
MLSGRAGPGRTLAPASIAATACSADRKCWQLVVCLVVSARPFLLRIGVCSQAIETVQQERAYHILVIIADGTAAVTLPYSPLRLCVALATL